MRFGVGMCARPSYCALVAEGRPSLGRRAAVALGCPGDIPPPCLMVLLKVSLGPGLGASTLWLGCDTAGTRAAEILPTTATVRSGPWDSLGLIEFLAPVRERTGALLKSWALCGSALGPHRTHGPCA